MSFHRFFFLFCPKNSLPGFSISYIMLNSLALEYVSSLFFIKRTTFCQDNLYYTLSESDQIVFCSLIILHEPYTMFCCINPSFQFMTFLLCVGFIFNKLNVKFIIVWAGIFLYSVDRFNEESEHGIPPVERSNRRPLLDGNNETLEESA